MLVSEGIDLLKNWLREKNLKKKIPKFWENSFYFCVTTEEASHRSTGKQLASLAFRRKIVQEPLNAAEWNWKLVQNILPSQEAWTCVLQQKIATLFILVQSVGGGEEHSENRGWWWQPCKHWLRAQSYPVTEQAHVTSQMCRKACLRQHEVCAGLVQGVAVT